MSEGFAKFIHHFDVIHNDSLPLDYVPILTTLQSLLPLFPCFQTLMGRTSDLGVDVEECSAIATPGNIQTKTPNFNLKHRL